MHDLHPHTHTPHPPNTPPKVLLLDVSAVQAASLRSAAAALCCCYRCVDTPCKACKRCLTDFNPFTTAPSVAALTAAQLPDAFRDFCINSAGRDPAVCEMARSGVASSFRGLAGRRAGAICSLLSECDSTLVSGCR